MIGIELVRVGDRLIGRRFQDRWNLAQLGYTHLDWSRNQSDVKKFRRFHADDFSISHVKGDMEAITSDERSMFDDIHVIREAA